MRTRNLSCLAVILTLCCLLPACRSPSDDDIRRLNDLRNMVPRKFEFDLQGEYYLSVRSSAKEDAMENEIIDIYKRFFFERNTDNRRNTRFVYLNYYGHDGKFRYQVAYDPKKRDFVRSKTEHY